ncbi:MAG: radical SAM protein [Thermodesulfobacteriota bacterium]
MSNLGFQSVYNLFNSIDDVVCERVFLPEKVDRDEFIRSGTRLFSLESQRPLDAFDLLAFSIPFEEDFLHVPEILRLAALPVFSRERGDGHPLVMAGGVALSLNPEPLAEFIDLFAIGEGESFLPSFVDVFRDCGGKRREGLLDEMAAVEGVYVPSLYNVEYDDGRIAGMTPLRGAPEKVTKAAPLKLDACRTPQSYITTSETEFGNTFLIEVERGCGRGCRFCAAGFVYLPMRERGIGGIQESVARGGEITGKVGLVGAAVSEYEGLKDIVRSAVERGGKVTLSSLRMDMLDGELLDLLKAGGYETITLAPEAGSQRMRDVINKGLSDREIMDAVSLVRDGGFNKVKLYFLVGLPTEGREDIEAILDLARRVRGLLTKGEVTLSVNPFIPKPWTPFQWAPYEEMGRLGNKLAAITKGCARMRGVRVKTYSPRIGYLQALLSRGDRRVAPVVEGEDGKGWRTFMKRIADPDRYVYRERGYDETLPWDIIDHGIQKEYLWNEYERGLKGRITSPCDVGRCFRCGVCT